MFNYTKRIKASIFDSSFNKAFDKMGEALDSMSDTLDKIFANTINETSTEIESDGVSISITDGKVNLKGNIKEVFVNGTKIYPKGN